MSADHEKNYFEQAAPIAPRPKAELLLESNASHLEDLDYVTDMLRSHEIALRKIDDLIVAKTAKLNDPNAQHKEHLTDEIKKLKAQREQFAADCQSLEERMAELDSKRSEQEKLQAAEDLTAHNDRADSDALAFNTDILGRQLLYQEDEEKEDEEKEEKEK